MKRLIVTLFALACATVGAAATVTENIDRTFDVRPGATLKLSNVNGRITIGSWDQPRVRVVATKKAEGDKDVLADYMKALRVDFQQRNGGLTVTTIQPKNDGITSMIDWFMGQHVNGQVSYTVTVPRNMNVDVENTNGAIALSDVTGMLELGTTNGRIEVARCGGSLKAATTNGAISAELVRVTKGQPLLLATTNGRIRIAVPADFAGEIDADTTNGAITTDFPVTTSRTDRNSLRGTVNGGGTELRARTTNGAIEIRKL